MYFKIRPSASYPHSPRLFILALLLTKFISVLSNGNGIKTKEPFYKCPASIFKWSFFQKTNVILEIQIKEKEKKTIYGCRARKNFLVIKSNLKQVHLNLVN